MFTIFSPPITALDSNIHKLEICYLITHVGAHDGTAHVWNVNNGMLLRRMNPRADVQCSKSTNEKPMRAEDVLGLLWSEENNRIGRPLV